MSVPATIEQETKGAVALPIQDSPTIQVFGRQEDFVAAQRMATALASSTLVPKEYQGNIPNILVAMELANRIGVSIFAAMQNLDIIHGKPSWRATFLIATVNSSGRFSPLRFRFVSKEGKDDWGCRAVATDRQSDEECVGPLVTIALAKKEGWHGKNGSKWKTIPELMLTYRAAAFWTRIYAPELSLGMHTSDEVTDMYVRPTTSKTATLAELTRSNDAAAPTQEASDTGKDAHQSTARGGSGHANGGTDATAPNSETLFKDDDSATDGGVSDIHRELVAEFDTRGYGNKSIESRLQEVASVSSIHELTDSKAAEVLANLKKLEDD